MAMVLELEGGGYKEILVEAAEAIPTYRMGLLPEVLITSQNQRDQKGCKYTSQTQEHPLEPL